MTKVNRTEHIVRSAQISDLCEKFIALLHFFYNIYDMFITIF